MKRQRVNLRDELERRGPGIVCLVGGGGKTTLLMALGAALAEAGRRVLCTTTTRLARPDARLAIPFVIEPDPARLTLPPDGALLAARPAPPGGDPTKVHGYAPGEIDALFLRNAADWILVEADGAAGRPLKAPADHEPVIPSLARVVVAVVGLSGLNRPLAPETVFRPERFSALSGLALSDTITPKAMTSIIAHPLGLFKECPLAAARLLYCGQADLPGAGAAGEALVGALAVDHPGFLAGIYMGSPLAEGPACVSFPEA